MRGLMESLRYSDDHIRNQGRVKIVFVELHEILTQNYYVNSPLLGIAISTLLVPNFIGFQLKSKYQ